MWPPGRSTLFLTLLLVFASSSQGLDLSRAFGKKNKDDPASNNNGGSRAMEPATINAEDALAHAKRLVNDLNDASTGTVTSYQPGREKAPVTCNEIMAKSVVVANEEKALMAAEKDAVVRAAALLAEKNDDLTSQLHTATEEISALIHAQETSEADHAAKLSEAAVAAALDLQEMEKMLSDQKSEHELRLKEVAEDAEREKEGARQKIMAEMERSRINLDALKNATSATIAKVEKETADELAAKDVEVAEKFAEAEAQIAQIKENTAEKLAANEIEVAKKFDLAESQIKQIQSETAEKLAAMEADVAEKSAEAERKIEQIELEAREKIDASQKGANDMVASITAKADSDKMNLLESTQKQVDDVKMEAEQKVSQKEVEMADKDAEHRKVVSELKATHTDTVKEMEISANNRVQEVRDEMERAIAKAAGEMSAQQGKHAEKVKEMENTLASTTQTLQDMMKSEIASADAKLLAEQEKHAEKVREMEDAMEKTVQTWQDKLKSEIASADAKLFAEQERYRSLEEEFQGYRDGSLDKQRSLDGDIKLLRSLSFKLEDEVSSWKGHFESQGYCNATLIKLDSKRLLQNAWDSTSDKVEKKILPKAVALYNQYLAEAVNENLLPIYNQHILPVYMEHVSPIVETIEDGAAVVIEKSSTEAHKVRSGAAKLVRQSSSSALGAMKEREIDSMLPVSLMTLLVRSSTDGEWVIDTLCKWLLIITAILFRSLILRIIWLPFSLMWFFCPLRLFVGGGQKMVGNNDGKKKANGKM
mmetsp:Transcript_38686/g.83351  ORF Transcript_38686/g.83351 Transcript_38686/m.83351 type:complete len:765 (+) Transcript_38686:180-2474(+)